jgi:hypothetical protein
VTLEPLPLPMSTDNMRRVIDSFRGLKPAASISIKPDSVQVLDPRGALVFAAKRTGSVWTACAKPGLINASFV